MPVPVVSIFGLSLEAPKPLYTCPIPMTLKRDEVAKPAVVPMEIGQYPTHKAILPGEIVANNTGSVPPEFLACNGKEVSRITYGMLFGIIGTYYGDGNGISYYVPFLSSARIIDGYYFYSLVNSSLLISDINNSFKQFFFANDNDYPLFTSFFQFGTIQNNGDYPMFLNLNCTKVISQNDFTVSLYDQTTGIGNDSSWTTHFGFLSTPYPLSSFHINGNTFTEITGSLLLNNSKLYLDLTTNFFYLRPFSSSIGLTTTEPGTFPGSFFNDIRIEIPVGFYDSKTLITAIQSSLAANPLTFHSSFVYSPQNVAINQPQYALFNIVITKNFTAADYLLDFYDTTYFFKCYNVDISIRNTTWDTTIGWILGFRKTQYLLSSYGNADSGHFVATITGEVTVNVNIYTQFLITLDDFNQCRLNDGLVSIVTPNHSIPLPDYSYMANFSCDPSTNKMITSGSTLVNQNNLTLNKIYSINQIQNSLQTPPSKSFSQGPFIKDMFGVIPIKTAGLQTGQVVSDYGGSLLQQERIYFGPVNIRRLQIQLFNNQGTLMDLNGADWNFSFICEQLYQQSNT
jgi:hypothetical protein